MSPKQYHPFFEKNLVSNNQNCFMVRTDLPTSFTIDKSRWITEWTFALSINVTISSVNYQGFSGPIDPKMSATIYFGGASFTVTPLDNYDFVSNPVLCSINFLIKYNEGPATILNQDHDSSGTVHRLSSITIIIGAFFRSKNSAHQSILDEMLRSYKGFFLRQTWIFLKL